MSKINKPDAFFDAVRKTTDALSKAQVETINQLTAAAANWPIGWAAYGLATAWHEAKFVPQDEVGKGRGKPYGKPGVHHGQIPYGRGLVQLTWDGNYEWADHVLGLNGRLLAHFAVANEPLVAARILVKGMETGHFTGRKLGDYILGRGTHEAFVSCRRVINGTDKADLIAGYADAFQSALDIGEWK